MSVDPNWLLSTTAQSAAALVAIIGGFLVSRLVAISTTRQGLKQRLQENSAMRSATQSELNEITTAVKATARAAFREEAAGAFAINRGSVPADLALRQPRGAQPADMAEWSSELAGEVLTCTETVERALRPYEITVDPAVLAVRHVDLGMFDSIVLSNVISAVEATRRPGAQSDVPTHPRSEESGGPARRDDLGEEQGQRIAQAAELSARLNTLDAEKGTIAGQLAQAVTPRGIYPGLAVLTYFAFVAIVLPLGLMASRPVPGGLAIRRLIFVSFVSGLLSVLGYLCWLVRDTRKS